MGPLVAIVFGLCILGSCLSSIGSSCATLSASSYTDGDEDSLNKTLQGIFSGISSFCSGLCLHICITMILVAYVNMKSEGASAAGQ